MTTRTGTRTMTTRRRTRTSERAAQAPATVIRATLSVGADVAPRNTQVVPDHLDAGEHVAQVAGDGHLLDRVGELAVLDPEPGGAARVVARHQVHAEPDQLRHVEPGWHRGDDRLGRVRPGLEVEVASARRRAHRRPRGWRAPSGAARAGAPSTSRAGSSRARPLATTVRRREATPSPSNGRDAAPPGAQRVVDHGHAGAAMRSPSRSRRNDARR